MLDQEIIEFQENNCLGCTFADKELIGKGPCCHYFAGLITKGGYCYTRVDEQTDEYRCLRCNERSQRVDVSDQALYRRLCEACYSGHRKPYYIEYRPTGERALTYAESAQEACQANGWMIGDCYIQEAIHVLSDSGM